MIQNKSRHKILCVGRQAGKTSLAIEIAIVAILEGKKVLWASPAFHFSDKPCKEIIDKLSIIKTASNHTTHQYAFKTGGTLTVRSGDDPDSFRSLNFDLVIFDEFAFAKEECWGIIRPVISARKGKAIIISTPNGSSGLFHQMFHDYEKLDEWATWHLPCTVSPLMTEEEINKAKGEVGELRFRQEYMAEWLSMENAIFPEEWFRGILVDQMPNHPQRAMIGVDLSMAQSLHSDFQVCCYLCYKDGLFYADSLCERMPITQLVDQIVSFYHLYKPEGIVVETNGFQQLVASELYKKFKVPPPIYEQVNTVNKVTRISRLSTLLARKQLRILNNQAGKEMLNQFRAFPSKKHHDDSIDALESAWRALCQT